MKNEVNLTLENSIAYTNFESFKNTNLHHLHKTSPLIFIKEIKQKQLIEKYQKDKKYLYANYLYALCKYLIKKYNLNEKINIASVFITKRYVFPSDTYIKANILNDTSYLYDAYNKAIPEFLKFNIIEVII